MPRLAAHCRWVRLEDSVFVLDLHAGDYLGLEPAASELWEQIVAGRGNRPEAEALLNDIAARGWLEPDVGLQEPGISEPTAPLGSSSLRAFSRLLQARWLVAHAGFARAYAWAAKRASFPRLPAAISLDRALAAFARAERLLPSALGLNDCLPRSLALFVFLADAGFGVTHHIGVRRFPFTGHAWVMAGAEPVNEDRAVVDRYAPIATIVA